MSGDVEALADVLRAHLPKDRYDDGVNVGTYCSCGGWEGDYFADGEAGPFDDHLASVLAAHVQAARADELERAADDIQALHPGEVKNSVTWLRATDPAPEEER